MKYNLEKKVIFFCKIIEINILICKKIIYIKIYTYFLEAKKVTTKDITDKLKSIQSKAASIKKIYNKKMIARYNTKYNIIVCIYYL